MKIELKKVKIHKDMSEETTCFSAEIWIDGKLAGQARNAGHGGETEVHIRDRNLEKQFHDYCESLPPLPPSEDFNKPLPMDADLYISELLTRHEVRQEIVRWCKKQIVFRIKGDKPGWRTIKGEFNPKVKAHLVTKYGDKLECIANENIEAAIDLEVKEAA